MPEPSNETLAVWLKELVATVLDVDAIKAYQAAVTQVAKCGPRELLDVVALAHHAAGPAEKARLAEQARTQQKDIPLVDNDGIVAWLAAAATIRVLTSPGDARIVAGLAAQSAAFIGHKPDLPEIPRFADETIAQAGDAVRHRALNHEPIAPKVAGWVDEGNAPATEPPSDDGRPQWEVPAFRVAEALDDFAAEVRDRLRLLDEEYNLLWWSHAERSTVADARWDKVDPPARRVVLVAHELSERVTRIPATVMVDGLAAVALGGVATMQVSLTDLVVAAREEGVTVGGIEHPLLPISTAMAQAAIYDDDTWVNVLKRVFKVNVKDEHPGAVFARQLIREFHLGEAHLTDSDVGIEPAGDVEPKGDVVQALPENDAPVQSATADDGWVGLPGSTSLSWDAANRVAAHHPSTVVLVAGNQYSGKTTLLVQLWAQFLEGPFVGLRFAGSETLDAFDDRHYPSRLDSGNPYPDTEHTTDTDMRFLHLRVAEPSGERHALLMTDLWGDLFSDIASGAQVRDRVPVAPRADKTMVLIDGAQVTDPTKREAALRNAKVLIGAFASDGGVRLDAPLLVLLSKADCLRAKDQAWYKTKVAKLVEFAKTAGFTNVDELSVAARPLNADPEGLDAVMRWMCARDVPTPIVFPERAPRSGRVFTTGRMAVV